MSPGLPGAAVHGVPQGSAGGPQPVDDGYEYAGYYGCPLPDQNTGPGIGGDACTTGKTCTSDTGDTGVSQEVFRRKKGTDGNSWTGTGTHYCAAPGTTPPTPNRPARPAEPVITLHDLQELHVHPTDLHIQPGTDTLKNYHTNIILEPRTHSFQRRMNGHTVQIRATPVSFDYDYGDGHRTGPTDQAGTRLAPGQWDIPTPTSHQYRSTGNFTLQVTTHYRGQYRAGNGGWKQVPGLLDVPSPPVLLRVWRTRNGWVQDGCHQNPDSWGCRGTTD